MNNNLYRIYIRPRLYFFNYIVVKIILIFVKIYYFIIRASNYKHKDTLLCIEAGEKGWESIEFKEMYKSACEYITSERVIKHIVNKKISYIDQLSDCLQRFKVSHFVYDPRTGSDEKWLSQWQSIRASILFIKYNVTPIVILADFPNRNARTLASIVTAVRGVVYCFMSPSIIGSVFPHNRLIGPTLMPFSCDTINMLDAIISSQPKRENLSITFIGSLYEPRISILEKIRTGLISYNINLIIKGRKLIRRPDEEYWFNLCFSDMVLTTADQEYSEELDFNHVPHLVYRYLEAMACGALLVAPDISGIRRYFTPGVHFAAFTSPNNAIEVIEYYYNNSSERSKVANQGKERARSLIAARIFWTTLDISLGSDSLF